MPLRVVGGIYAHAVKLKLKGQHAHSTLPELPLNAAIEHYCTFYQLLQPVTQTVWGIAAFMLSL